MDGYVYLATDGELYKIGKTTDLEKRPFGLNREARMRGSDAKVRIIHSFPCVDSGHAERTLHDLLVGCRKHGEWFDLSEKQVEIIKSISVGDETYFPAEEIAPEDDYDVNFTVRIPKSVKERLSRYVAGLNPMGYVRTRVQDVVTEAIREYLTNHNGQIAKRLTEGE